MAVEAINWEAIEDAIRTWVMGATGYADAQVMFADEHTDAPSGDWITVRIGDLISRAGTPSEVQTYDAAQTAGSEVELKNEAPEELIVSIQAFTADTRGNSSARAVLTKARAGLGLGLYRDALNAAGLGLIDEGNVLWVPQPFGTRIEGRATLDVRFLLVQTASERVGYIATVELTNQIPDPDTTFTVP